MTKPIHKMTTAELCALVDGDIQTDEQQALAYEAERELWRRAESFGDQRVAQGSGNAIGEEAS